VPGAGNPLAWNRYAYTLYNPLKYTDPSGRLTEEQIKRWTGHDKEYYSADVWEMLINLRLGDYLYAYDANGALIAYGLSWLDESGHLVFNDLSIFDIINTQPEGFVLCRMIGNQLYIANSNNGYELEIDNSNYMFSVSEHEELVGNKYQIQTLVASSIAGFAVGLALDAFTPFPPVFTEFITLIVGIGFGLVDIAAELPGKVPGDRILKYYYQDEDGEMWSQTTIIRDDQIIYYGQDMIYTPLLDHDSSPLQNTW